MRSGPGPHQRSANWQRQPTGTTTQGQTLTADYALAGLDGMGTVSYPSQRGWQEIAFSEVKV